MHLLANTLNENGFLFLGQASGFIEVYSYLFDSKEVFKLTNFNSRENGVSCSVDKDTNKLNVVHFYEDLKNNKFGINLIEVDDNLKSIKILDDYQTNKLITLSRFKNNKIFTSLQSFDEPPFYAIFNIIDGKIKFSDKIEQVTDSNSLINGQSSYLTYKSFDGLEICGYFLKPNVPIKAIKIKSFYGGYNSYDKFAHFYAENGIAVFSPGVRGSWGFGKEWESYLVGDLGGGEILDLVWAARFLEKKFKLKSSQIGLEGGSHGGYAVLRALTMPQNFKGVDSQYPFGFGICWAGFADLEDFFKTSNIPDWIVMLLGDYEQNKDKYLERSPSNFVNELKTPLFITYGEKDSRVPPSTVFGFINDLKKFNKKYYLHVHNDQGHTGGNKKQNTEELKAVFKFFNHFEL